MKLGRRTAGREAEYEALLGEIATGVALHYASDGVDPDLDLLLGDQRYAHGLAQLAALGDLPAIEELGDVISLVSAAHAAGDQDLAEAIWEAGVTTIGWGATAALRQAKNLALAGNPGAAAALRAAAAQTRGEAT